MLNNSITNKSKFKYKGEDTDFIDLDNKCNDENIKNQLISKKILPTDFALNPEYKCDVSTYILDTIIGKGGNNDVYSILDVNDKVFRVTNTPVNMNRSKILNTKGNAEINGLYIQFYLSKLCENICKIYEFGTFEKENGTYVYAVLEKLEDLQTFYANNLKQFQDSNITNNDMFYKKILKDALTGLSCMHENNYYHFDIKIENIGYTKESNIGKLIDFGSARYLTDECVTDVNFIPSFYYTDPYILQKDELCKYNDLYSFAMVLFTIESLLSVKSIFKTIINDLIKPLTYDNLTTIFNTFWDVQNKNPNPLTKQQLYDNIFKESYEKIKYYNIVPEKDSSKHLKSINDYYKTIMIKRISATEALKKYSKLFDTTQQGGKKKSRRKKTKKQKNKKTTISLKLDYIKYIFSCVISYCKKK